MGDHHGHAQASRRLGQNASVAVVLDRYGPLLPGHGHAVLDRLDGFAGSPSVTTTTAPNPLRPRGAAGLSRGERERREPESSRHGLCQVFYRGRWGFRTLDLCRVKADRGFAPSALTPRKGWSGAIFVDQW